MAATKAAARHTYRGEPTQSSGTARRGRELEPAWVGKLERQTGHKLSLDEIGAAEKARKLPLDTDPDSIGDADVRRMFGHRLNAIDRDEPLPGDEDDRRSPGGGKPSPVTGKGGRQGSGGRSSSPTIPRPTLTPPRRLSVADGSGFALGLVLYALALNYLRYGWPGVTGWVSAKFVNKPMGAPAARGPADTGSYGPGSAGGNAARGLTAPKPTRGHPTGPTRQRAQ